MSLGGPCPSRRPPSTRQACRDFGTTPQDDGLLECPTLRVSLWRGPAGQSGSKTRLGSQCSFAGLGLAGK